jgi:hypothetical protein
VKAIVEESAAMIKSLNGVIAEIETGDGTLTKILKDPTLYNNLNSDAARLDTLLGHLVAEPRIPVNLRVSLGDPEGKERARLMKATRKAEKGGK